MNTAVSASPALPSVRQALRLTAATRCSAPRPRHQARARDAAYDLVVGDPPVPSSDGVSARMRRQPRRDTEPELAVRRLLHADGFRFRLCVPVPGLPRRTIDIAFPASKVAIFIDGCFWHGCPEHPSAPTANAAWWAAKIAKNRTRDIATTAHLQQLGWTVVRVWEHEASRDAVGKIEMIVLSRRAGSSSVHAPP